MIKKVTVCSQNHWPALPLDKFFNRNILELVASVTLCKTFLFTHSNILPILRLMLHDSEHSHCFDVLIIIECSTNKIYVWREHDWHLLTQCKTAFSHLQNLFFSQENKSVVISNFLSNLFSPEKLPISLAKKEISKTSFDWQYLRH